MRKLTALALDLAVLAAVGLVVLGLSYLFGHDMLWRDLVGNDSPLHVGYATWLDSEFPSIPHWYPLQGGGISLLHGYPLLSHLLLVVLHRVTSLSILQLYRAVSFASVPLAALGVYAFARTVLKSRTAGGIAAVFYLLSPITWTWLYNWGFFAQQVAFVLLPLALLAFDRTWRASVGPRKDRTRRLWFVACAVLVVLATLSHILVGFASLAGMFLYAAFATLPTKGPDRRTQFTGGLRIVVMLGVTLGLIAAAYLVPFFNYGQVANRGGVNTPTEEQLHRLSVAHFFGVTPVEDREVLTRMQFPLVVSLAAGMGLLAAFAQKSRDPEAARPAIGVALTAAGAAIFAVVPALPGLVLTLSSVLIQFINFRSMLLVVMVLMPVVAGHGLASLPRLLLVSEREPISTGQASQRNSGLWRLLRAGLASTLALFAAGTGVAVIGNQIAEAPSHLPYGPQAEGVDLADIWDRGPEYAGQSLAVQLRLTNWPSVELSNTDRLTMVSQSMAALIDSAEHTRIDISPYEGRLAMDLVTFTDASQINSYTFTASLIHAMWGYQQNVYYSHETPVSEYGNPTSLMNASTWFGTEYVYLDPTQDDPSLYQQAGWERSYDDGGVQLWHNPAAPPMAELVDKPVILVISKLSTDGYMNLFRLANDGMLPFGEALLVEGEPRVDSYTTEELGRFDAVFLYGYDYRSSRKAWDTLEEYVSQGGSLFVDTGWEFQIPEWEFDQAPAVLPLERLTWTNYGADPSYALGPADIVGSVDSGAFKPLTWEGIPWMLSGGALTDVRAWGMPLLTANGNPLIVAGQLGAGRVVWSGMNLIAHAQYQGKNEEEVTLIHNLIGWLVGADATVQPGSVLVSRTHPDRVEFSIEGLPAGGSWLYWREAFYPRWQASLVDASGERELPVYRAGPGFMLMPLGSVSGTGYLALDWVPSASEKLAFVASAGGILLLAAHVVDGLLLGGNGLTWLRIAIVTRIPRPFLGEGSNKDWAERKRRELTAGELGPKTYQPFEAIPWMRSEAEAATEATPTAQANGQEPEEPLSIEEHEQLLAKWLDEGGHADDGWAERLLGRKQTNKES